MKSVKIRILLIFGLSWMLLANTGCDVAEERQNKYLDRAEQHYSDGKLDKSKIEIKNVLQINPKNSEAKLLLAKINKDSGEYKKAFALYSNVIEDEPKNIEARIELAKIFFAGKVDDSALEHIDEVLDQNPKHKDAQLLVAAIESRRGHNLQAIDLAESVLADYPHDPGASAIIASALIESDPQGALARLNDGLSVNRDNLMLKKLKLQILNTLGKETEVEALLREISEENPQLLNFQFQLARGLSIQKRNIEAENVLTKAVNHNPTSTEAKLMLLNFIIQHHGVAAGEQTIIKFIKSDPDSFELKELQAKFYMDNQQPEQAKAVFQNLLKLNTSGSESISARYHLALILLSEKQRDAAEKLLAEIFNLEPNNTNALILRSKLSLKDGQTQDAIADLRAALKNNDKSIDALNLLAKAQERVRAHQLALDSYHRILELDPTDKAALLGAANINLNMNEDKRAQALLEKLVSLDQTNTTAVAMLIRLYGNQQLWAKAEALLPPLLELNGTKTAGLIQQGNIKRGQNQWPQAQSYYRQALDREPEVLEAVAGYTDGFLITKDYLAAKQFLQTHIAAHPQLDYAKEMLAKVYQLEGDNKSAIAIYQQLIAQAPKRISPVQKLGELYIGQKHYAEAEKILVNGIQGHPRAIDLQLLLAGVYDAQSRFSDSIDIYKAILAKNPKNAIARNNYSVLLVNYFPNDKNLTLALELAAPLADSGKPLFLDTLGWAHYKNGNYQQAISYLRAAVKQLPDNEELRYHLGMAYLKNGDKISAKSELRLATQTPSTRYFGRDEAEQVLQSI